MLWSCIDDTGMPTSADQVIGRATRLIEGLAKIRFEQDRIYLDPLDTKILSAIKVGETLLGKDDCCAEYLTASRKNQLAV